MKQGERDDTVKDQMFPFHHVGEAAGFTVMQYILPFIFECAHYIYTTVFASVLLVTVIKNGANNMLL